MTNENWHDGDGRPVLVLAHGAGAPADSPFMATLARALAAQSVSVVRFEFDYMRRRRLDGRKRPPGSVLKLRDEFAAQVEAVVGGIDPQRPVFVGGKSMGGRVASLLAAEPSVSERVAGAVAFGYPFHPPSRPERWRTEHFATLRRALCVVQGTRDPFGKPDEIVGQPFLSEVVQVQWLEGGDHDLRPLKRQPESQSDLIHRAATLAAAFMVRTDSLARSLSVKH